jgi:hypothetical protein
MNIVTHTFQLKRTMKVQLFSKISWEVSQRKKFVWNKALITKSGGLRKSFCAKGLRFQTAHIQCGFFLSLTSDNGKTSWTWDISSPHCGLDPIIGYQFSLSVILTLILSLWIAECASMSEKVSSEMEITG